MNVLKTSVNMSSSYMFASIIQEQQLGTNIVKKSSLCSLNIVFCCILDKLCGAQSFQLLRFLLHCSGLCIQSSQYTTVVTCMCVLRDVFKFHIVRIEYIVHYSGVKISGAGMIELHQVTCMCVLRDVFKFSYVVNCGGPMLL